MVAGEGFSFLAFSLSILSCSPFTCAEKERDGRSFSKCCKALEDSKRPKIRVRKIVLIYIGIITTSIKAKHPGLKSVR